jgi:Sec-independent protein secretion pathway component TatC
MVAAAAVALLMAFPMVLAALVVVEPGAVAHRERLIRVVGVAAVVLALLVHPVIQAS